MYNGYNVFQWTAARNNQRKRHKLPSLWMPSEQSKLFSRNKRPETYIQCGLLERKTGLKRQKCSKSDHPHLINSDRSCNQLIIMAINLHVTFTPKAYRGKSIKLISQVYRFSFPGPHWCQGIRSFLDLKENYLGRVFQPPSTLLLTVPRRCFCCGLLKDARASFFVFGLRNANVLHSCVIVLHMCVIVVIVLYSVFLKI